jgi:hypothetical protein
LLQLVQRNILKATGDLKAESLLAMAMEKGLEFDDFLVSCDSLFCREYNKDVVFTEIREDPRKLSVLQCHLSRSGIFDHLPEGLFFQPAQASARHYSAIDMVHDYRRNKQKEQEIRRFFQPFENDFFLQRLQLELEEIRLLEGLQSGILNEYFINFWGIPIDIPRDLIVPFIVLLPYASKIAGDLPLMSQCLEKLLNEKVSVKKGSPTSTGTACLFNQTLGKQTLGADMICGEYFSEDYPVLEFTIGPLKKSGIADYLEQGKYYIFLQTFYQFFVPVGVDVITNIEVPTEQKSMCLQQDNEPVLGYSSVLGM